MRLNRLDLTRYGRFSDAQIVLPAPKGDAADVTVIYGPNEAGKSTAFSAYLELLYGMKSRDHPYEFRFKRSDLLVGAELELPDRGRIVLQRNSKRTQSLLDEHGTPVDQTLLTAALQGLTREAYVERFSLNDHGLREGGRRIAGAKGDLGQLLHAGVSGLTSMATTLDQISARADQFHKKGGRSTQLKLAKDRLTEIAQELRVTQLTPEREQGLNAACDKAKDAFDSADDALNTVRKRQTAQKAAQLWYDRSTDIAELDTKLAEFPQGTDLRKGAAEAIARLVAILNEKALRLSEATETIKEQTHIIDNAPVDEAAEDLTAALADLDQIEIDGASLIARAASAMSDLDNRIKERDALDNEMKRCLAELDIADAPIASMVLEPDQIEELAHTAQAVLTTTRAAKEAAEAVDRANEQRGDAPTEPQDLSHLQVAWDRWQAVADVSVQRSHVAGEAARLKLAVAGLPDAWADLITAGLPAHQTLTEVATTLTQVTADLKAAQDDHTKRAAAYDLARAKRKADEAAPAAIDPATTAQARRVRDAKWVAHRDALCAQTADAFETAMHSDDDAQASFAMGADARGQLAAARRDEAAALVLRDTAQERCDALHEKQSKLTARASRLATSLGLASDTNPAAFTERHAALDQAAQIAAQLENAKTNLQSLSDQHSSATKNLASAAKAVGITCADADLPTQVRTALTLQNSVRQTWDHWSRTKNAITELADKAAKAKADKDAAKTKLATLTATLPLAGRGAQDINTALPHLRNLQRAYRDHDKMRQRIAALENAIDRLRTSAKRIGILAQDQRDPNDVPLEVIEAARSRIAKAKMTAARRDEAQNRRNIETKAKTAAKAAIEAAQHELDEWFKNQGGADMPPLTRVALLVERDELRATRRRHDAARNEARDATNSDLFDAELDQLPDASRAAEIEQMLNDAQEVRDLARDASNEAARLYKEAFEADDRADLTTEQATIREELRSGVRQAAVQRLGVLVAQSALRRLASERRTTMLRDVEQAFVSITDPAWIGVDVWGQSTGEKLVGIQPDGTPVPVEMMSTGTMGQLYFALRVAGYRSFARDLGPLPMILDDIMETFDDTRAKASLQLCAEIGRCGQAIIFTHHAHLVDLARDTIAGVNIVEMPH